ncbi:MAG: FAD:protein FMN transferase [Magnetospirillum sp.]|nr:FAD:protein FMN transferase [Magnetospirillum sp.]
MQKTSLTRRRFLTISAVAGAALAVSRGRSAAAQQVETWAGSAMGSSASIRLYHHTDATVVRRVLARCAAEAERLEQIFSLYRSDSELVRLNKAGVLDAPAHDLVVLLGESMAIAGRTNGAFDPTVQPLFRAYADHFGVPGRSADGPPRQVIADALSRVGWRDMVAEPGRIAFVRPGMELTLNGIAQGYITDRITDMLKAAGFERVLVNMGEIRSLGRHPDGRPWSVAIESPYPLAEEDKVVSLADAAIATSSPAGTVFDQQGRCHHLFDPATGQCANAWQSVTVIAPRATTADALSTAFSTMNEAQIRAVMDNIRGVHVLATRASGVVKLS